ncbi:hypothetical protein P389DRAFT_46759 [Cystobasidium minutum MCA 4210]|uniref:uncharacterized protein n=1 Tax=Cystobasidium minutum MCA 4210 TaxID=1397322 RepID=UPI0034CFC66A|eukprot:jgi/Rhomi1/46759/CE46758_199
MAEDDKKKRPEPPKAVESPLPHLAEAMKKLGDMQVTITKVCEELEVKRQAEYIAAVAAWDSAEADKKAKENADKVAAENLFNKREVARLKKKLGDRPCAPDKHPMGNPRIVARVLQQDAFDKKNLQAFCLISKAWVLPCRTLMFVDLSELDVSTKARCDNLIDLLTKRPALCEVVKSMKFSFQPPDPAANKQDALREALPSPIQFILLLTLCSEATKLEFMNVATFGATKVILSNISGRIEKVTMDPAGYAWHGKELEFGTHGPRSLFGDWPHLREVRLARLSLRVDDPLTYANRRERAGDRLSAGCPLTYLSLEKVRLHGRLYHALEGAFHHLTTLSLQTVGSLQLRDLCQILMEHGQSLLNLTLIGNQIIEPDARSGDQDAGWGGRGEEWVPGGRAPTNVFDRALGHCVNLTSLSCEPGMLPVYQPSTLFRPLVKLETLQFNKREASGYDPTVWRSCLGLMPVLSEQRRKMKKIKFGHDWPSSARQIASLQDVWGRFSEVVELGKMPLN